MAEHERTIMIIHDGQFDPNDFYFSFCCPNCPATSTPRCSAIHMVIESKASDHDPAKTITRLKCVSGIPLVTITPCTSS